VNEHKEPSEHEQRSFTQRLKDQSLKVAGMGYVLGDASLFASGMLAGRSKEATTGLIYMTGGLVCAKYGNPDAEAQCKLLSETLGDYFRKEGIEIPDNPDTAKLNHKGGVIDGLERFMYSYPSQILNTFYAVGGAQLLRSGLQHNKKWDAAAGALVAAGGLSGLLIKEKKPDPEHPPEGLIEKAVSFAQEKPLRISGALYSLNNVSLVMSAVNEMQAKPANKSYLFKFLTAGSFVFSNMMLSMTSKDNINADDKKTEALQNVAHAAAVVIAAQPPEIQEVLVANVAGHLASQSQQSMKAAEIGQLLHEQLAAVAAGKPLAPAASSWQAKLAQSQPQFQHPTL
jgi:hypothetical protein